VIVDAQSVKNTDTAGFKGYDAGKKVSGIKRHIAVDTLGLPHAIAVTTANVTDRQGALQAFERCTASLSAVQVVLTDAGYTGNPFAMGVKQLLGEHVQVQIAKRSELHRFEVMPPGQCPHGKARALLPQLAAICLRRGVNAHRGRRCVGEPYFVTYRQRTASVEDSTLLHNLPQRVPACSPTPCPLRRRAG